MSYANQARLAGAVAILAVFVCGISQALSQATGTDTSAVKLITVSFKFDPGPTYGGPRWVSPPAFITGMQTGKEASIEIKLDLLNAAGKAVSATPEWTTANPEMVVVSPITGGAPNQYRISVNRSTGESMLKVTAQGITKELLIKTTPAGAGYKVEIIQPAPATKPTSQLSAAENVGSASALSTPKQKFSYAYGMSLAQTVQKKSLQVDSELVNEGFKDTLNGNARLSEQEVKAALIGLQIEERNDQIAQKTKMLKELGEQNQRDGEAFLAANKTKEGVVSLPSGLQYKILKAGDGRKATSGDMVVCQYRGTLIDGTEFDSSYRRKEPVTLPMRGIISGWSEALELMPAGSKWELYVPPSLAYGARGNRKVGIGPNATLIFDVELLSVEDKPQTVASQLR
jgi:FKBP-type peptidyl-prolyl cis-trans isomerase FklB